MLRTIYLITFLYHFPSSMEIVELFALVLRRSPIWILSTFQTCLGAEGVCVCGGAASGAFRLDPEPLLA